MNTVKKIVKKIVPPSFIRKIRKLINKRKLNKAKRIFSDAKNEPSWLGWDDLKYLQSQYPFPDVLYAYDSDSLIERGKERVKYLYKLIPFNKIDTVLELGCGDGMVSCILQRKAKTVTAIDHNSNRFDERARNDGVKLLEMDASSMAFKDNSFDFVFSYDSFEHFANPEFVLKEAIRVVKKKGYIYLNFGSPYMSARGLHAYQSITVPYCEVLFKKEMLKDFIKKNNLTEVDFNFVNGWTLDDFRKLWIKFSTEMKLIKKVEIPTFEYLDLIEKYPSCFKSKTSCFDNFIYSAIEVLFQRN